jgi:hypothetical protein
MTFRIWTLAVATLIVGLAIGWGWTVAELGYSPRGSDRVAWGNPPAAKSPSPLPSDGPKGKVAVDETEFDFGKMETGGAGRHDFVIRNAGKGTLLLEKGPTTCSCTVSEIDHTQLAPGESAKVTLQWHPKGHGPFRQSASVSTNDPEKPALDLTISGELVSSYLVDPARLVFTGITSDASFARQVSVYSFTSDKLSLTTPRMTDHSFAQYFETSVTPMTADELKEEEGAKSGCRLQVKIKPGLPAGAFEQRIRFQLSLPDHPEAEVVVEGSVASPIDVVGPKWDSEREILMLGPVHAQEGAKAQLYLMIRGEAQQHADVKLHEVQPDTLKVTLGTLEHLTPTTSRVPVSIEIPKGSRIVNHMGSQSGGLARIYIDTGLADVKQLRLLVQYAVEE